MPVRMASLSWRTSCTWARARSLVIQPRLSSGAEILPSSVMAVFSVTSGRAVRMKWRNGSLSFSASAANSSGISTTIPASRSLAKPSPATKGFGSATGATTRATPAWISASTQGGVRPTWEHLRCLLLRSLRIGHDFVCGSLRSEDQNAERRQDEFCRAGLVVAGLLRRRHPAAVAHVAPALNRRVAVQQLAPLARARQPHPVLRSRDRSQIRDHHQFMEVFRILAQERKHAVCMVGVVDPMEAIQVVVGLPEGGLRQVQLVEVLDEPLQAAMIRPGLQQLPLEFAVSVPFVGLAEFAAHEQKLLAGKQPLIPQQRPQVCKSPPIVARHPAQQ